MLRDDLEAVVLNGVNESRDLAKSPSR
jgi:hypothetical protein